MSKTLTPEAVLDCLEIPDTGHLIALPVEVISIIWSSSSTGKAATIVSSLFRRLAAVIPCPPLPETLNSSADDLCQILRMLM